MLLDLKRTLAQDLNANLQNVLGKTTEEVFALLEIPKKVEMGHLALPVFPWAKQLKKSPPQIAQEWAEAISIKGVANVQKVQAVGGYLNFVFTDEFLQASLFSAVEGLKTKLGFSDRFAGKRAVIDFASPNVAKPMHIGHLRATVIGQAICNLARSQGYEVVGLNHLGDWGVQFGKLAWAYKQYGASMDFSTKPFESLYQLYVRFHQEAEGNKSIEEMGAKEFKKLEDGDVELTKLWRWFVEISMTEYKKIWDEMGVHHDKVVGESFYNDRLKAVESELAERGLLEESDGAMVVKLEDLGLPPCLIRKSDGASLYATRDLASADYRKKDLQGDLLIYVVGAEQSLHFQQVFAVLKRMGRTWAESCHHISFGIYLFKDEKMSSRKGQVIALKDLIDKSVAKVAQIIEDKNPNLNGKDQVSRQVGIGAIVFNDLVNDRVKNVDFSWEKALSFEGDSGPYVQYSLVRCRSILRKAGAVNLTSKNSHSLSEPTERELIRLLLSFDQALRDAFDNFKPHILCHYLLDVCRAFSQFYNQCRILGEPSDVEQARLRLVICTERIIESGLKILNIACPREM